MKTIHELYLEEKAKQNDILLLIKCGAFYETYDDDAAETARILGITLTKRAGVGTRMAGFPYHALDAYLPKLIRAGKRVRIADKDELEKNNKTKNNMEKIENKNVKNTISILSNAANYYYNPTVKALVKIEIANTFIDFDNCECRQYENSTGENVLLTPDYDYYYSEQDFQDCNPLAEPFEQKDKQNILMSMTYICNVKTEEGTGRKYTLIFDNGKPTRWYLDENIHTMWGALAKNGRYELDFDGATIPKSYKSEKSLSLFNDYDIIECDGTKTTHYGEAKPLMLNEEQKALWDEYVDLVDRMEKAGARLIYSKEEDNMFCVNGSAVEDMVPYYEDVNEDNMKLAYCYEEFPSVFIRALGYEETLVVKKLNK